MKKNTKRLGSSEEHRCDKKVKINKIAEILSDKQEECISFESRGFQNCTNAAIINIFENALKMKCVGDDEALHFLNTISERIIAKSTSQ